MTDELIFSLLSIFVLLLLAAFFAAAETAGVVLHPTCLKGCILPIIGKDQQSLPLRMMHHVLGEHMHILGGREFGWPPG